MHLARSGRLIIKASTQIRDGTPLVDSEGRRIGRVMETIGPVKSPYLSVQPMTDRVERLIGSKLFISENAEAFGKDRRRNFSPQGRKFKSDKRQGGRSEKRTYDQRTFGRKN